MVLLRHLKPKVVEIMRKLIIEDDRLKTYMDIFKRELNRSFEWETADDCDLKSYITYLNKLPSGKEEGSVLAMEFGGPTIKIMLMTLLDNKCQLNVQPYDIPQKLMVGKSKKVMCPHEKLFDFIAKCLSDFLKSAKLKMLRIPLGITFGFPLEQLNLQDCKLLRWMKGFQCDDLIGQNIFPRLKESFRKFPNLKRIFIIGILSETVSMMLAANVNSSNCKIAMVIGYSANCCYMEQVSRIGKYQAKTFSEKFMCVNLETSSFGEDGCLDEYRTQFDIQVDEESDTPGKLTIEKMTSITYLGEIARLALIKCIQSKVILGGNVTTQISQKNAFRYNHMMQIESDPEDKHSNCRLVLQQFGYKTVSDEDCIQIQFVCRCVSRRTANLMAAQLAALMDRINEPMITIALEGEMVRNYPKFEWYLLRKLQQLKQEELSFEVVKLEDNGLAKGAGVLASVFGKEIMDRDEKLRRLPGFPVNRCHFGKTGRCLNPNCGAKHPCDSSGINPMRNPMQTKINDLEPDCFNQSHCPKKTACFGYDQL